MGHDDTKNLQADSETKPFVVKGHLYDENLTFDLYGDWTRDGGCNVETVMIAGTDHNVTTLLSGKQLENLGLYLDLRSRTDADSRARANTYHSASTRY